MKILNDLAVTLGSKTDIVRKHHGLWFFSIQRLTGILLAVYLIPHILINSSALFGGPSAYTRLTGAVQGPAFHVLEILIILGVFYHMFNGLRILAADFLAMTRQQGTLLVLAVIATALTFIYSVWVYWPKLMGAE